MNYFQGPKKYLKLRRSSLSSEYPTSENLNEVIRRGAEEKARQDSEKRKVEASKEIDRLKDLINEKGD